MRVIIVEDETDSIEALKSHFATYGAENNCTFSIEVHRDAVSFLAAYRPGYDLILFDIEMPYLNGMEGARRLREMDPYVPIVFVTNMSQYAVKGYSVGAVDFILKPAGYFEFKIMLDRVRRNLALAEDKIIQVSSNGILRHLRASHIRYVEVYRHRLTFHTTEGEVDAWGSLSDVEKQLLEDGFLRCNNGFLVNLKYVDYVEKEEVILGEDRIPISHLRRKDFVQKLAHWIGQRR